MHVGPILTKFFTCLFSSWVLLLLARTFFLSKKKKKKKRIKTPPSGDNYQCSIRNLEIQDGRPRWPPHKTVNPTSYDVINSFCGRQRTQFLTYLPTKFNCQSFTALDLLKGADSTPLPPPPHQVTGRSGGEKMPRIKRVHKVASFCLLAIAPFYKLYLSFI